MLYDIGQLYLWSSCHAMVATVIILAVVATFYQWRQAKKKGQQAAFCAKYFVSHGTMLMLDGMRKQLWNELAQKGLVSKDLQLEGSTSSIEFVGILQNMWIFTR